MVFNSVFKGLIMFSIVLKMTVLRSKHVAIMWSEYIYNITVLIYCCLLTECNTLYKKFIILFLAQQPPPPQQWARASSLTRVSRLYIKIHAHKAPWWWSLRRSKRIDEFYVYGEAHLIGLQLLVWYMSVNIILLLILFLCANSFIYFV